MSQTTSTTQSTSVLQTPSGRQVRLLGLGAGAASSHRPRLVVTPSPTKATGLSVIRNQAPQPTGSQQVSVPSRAVSPVAQPSPAASPPPQQSSPVRSGSQHSPSASPPTPPPPPPAPPRSKTSSTSRQQLGSYLSQSSQQSQSSSRLSLPQPTMGGLPAPFPLQVPMLLSVRGAAPPHPSSSSSSSTTSTGNVVLLAPPHPHRSPNASTASIGHLAQSTAAPPHQRSMSSSTSMSTPSTTGPPQVRLHE